MNLNVEQVIKAVLELVASKLQVLGFNPLAMLSTLSSLE